MQKLKFLDLFSGIGGFRTGMIKAGNTPAGWCEIDKFARKSYKNMYNTKGEWNGKDINAVSNADWKEINKKYGKINVICAGFPCQSFSIAGKRKGFLDKTRGTLFFQVARAAKEIKPQYLFLENVKGLLNHRHGKTFATILSTLSEIGYNAEWQVLNSKNFGVPQNRERVYIIGHLRGSRTQQIFDWGREAETNSSKIDYYHNSKQLEYRIYNSDGVSRTLSATDYKHPIHVKYFYNARKHGQFGSTYDILRPDGVSNTLSTMQGGNRQPKIAYYHKDNKMDNRILRNTGISSSIRATGHMPKVALNKKPVEVIGSMQKHASKTDGTYSPTITQAMGSGGGQIPMPVFHHQQKTTNGRTDKTPRLKIREATKKGYAEAYPGDSVNMSYPKSKTRRGRVGHKVVNTLTASNTNGTQEAVITANGRTTKIPFKDLRVRKLTPKECWRLQGFPDSSFEKAKEVNSNSQLYKQAGNSVSVPVIEYIASRMKVLN